MFCLVGGLKLGSRYRSMVFCALAAMAATAATATAALAQEQEIAADITLTHTHTHARTVVIAYSVRICCSMALLRIHYGKL